MSLPTPPNRLRSRKLPAVFSVLTLIMMMAVLAGLGTGLQDADAADHDGTVSTQLTVESGNLVVADIAVGGQNDSLTIRSDTTTSTFVISDPNRVLGVNGTIAGAILSDDRHAVSVPFASVSGSIQVNTLGGNDSLTVDFSAGNVMAAVNYDGGGGDDALVIEQGTSTQTFGTVTYTANSATSGSIAIDPDGPGGATAPSTIDYSNLEPIDDNLDVDNRVFQFTGADETITLGVNAEVVTGDLQLLENGSPATTNTAFWNLRGNNGRWFADGDVIDIAGTDAAGNVVSGAFTVSDRTTNTLQDLFDEIESVFNGTAIAMIVGGQIQLSADLGVFPQPNVSLSLSSDPSNSVHFGNVDPAPFGAFFVTQAYRNVIDSTLGESVTFVSPNRSLRIETSAASGTGADVVTIEAVNPVFNADLTISADADDTVTFQKSPLALGSGNLAVDANSVNASVGWFTGGGTVTVAAATVDIQDVDTSAAVAGGAITISASADVTTGTLESSGGLTGGDVTVTSTNGKITTGSSAVQSGADTSQPGSQSGSISLSANGGITTGGLSSSGGLTGGAITLTSANGAIDAGLVATGTSESGSEGGDISLSASGDIRTGSLSSYGGLTGGDITVTSATGLVRTGYVLSRAGQEGGDISLSASGEIRTANEVSSSGAVKGGDITVTSANGAIGFSTGDFSSVVSAAALGESGGQGGNIFVSASGDVWALNVIADGSLAGGNVTVISANGTIGFTDEGTVFYSAIFVVTNGNISLSVDGDLKTSSLSSSGGAITLTSANGDVMAGTLNSVDSLTGGDITVEGINVSVASTDSGSGMTEFVADTLTIGAGARGSGSLIIEPNSADSPIGVGGGVGALNLDDTLLSKIQDGFSSITIGDVDAGTGGIEIGGAGIADAKAFLVGHFQFDEGTGVSTLNAANSINASLQNMDPANAWVSTDLPPVVSGTSYALQFDGVDDQVLPNGASPTGSNVTIALWMKAGSQTEARPTMVSYGNDSIAGGLFEIGVDASTGQLRFGGGGAETIGTANVLDGQWHHIVVRLSDDGSPNVGNVVFFVDGILDPHFATGDQMLYLPDNRGSFSRFAIGNAVASAVNGSPAVDHHFTGQLDEVRLYETALSDDEIRVFFEEVDVLFHDPITIAGGSITVEGLDAGTNDVNLVAVGGGTIHDGAAGTDVIGGNVTFDGNVSPGASPGILSVSGDVVFADNDTFTVEIGGTTPGSDPTDHDQIDVVGEVTIGSGVTLVVSAFGGFAPDIADEFILISNDGTDTVTGNFSGLPEGATVTVNEIDFMISYAGGSNNNDVVLVPGETSVFVTGGNLVISDVNGASSNDTLVIQSDTTNNRYVITETNAANGLYAGVGATQIDATTVYVPFGSVGGNIQVNTRDGNDSLTVDFSLGNFSRAIAYDGGTQASTPGDSLTLTGGTFATGTLTFTDDSTGTIDLTGNSQISYTGLEPIDTTGTTIDDLILTFNGGTETITLTDAAGAAMTMDSTAGESVTFANPSGSLTINAGTGDDLVNVTSVDSDGPFDAALTINGDGDDDTVNLGAALTYAADRNLTVTAETITVNAAQTLNGAGAVSLTAEVAVTVSANVTGGTGGVSITGSGTAALDSVGVTVDSGAVVTALGSGTVTVDGTGGAGAGNANYGVAVTGAGSQITSGGGEISITGVSGAGTSSPAIRVASGASVVGTAGTPTVTLIGDSMELISGSIDAGDNTVVLKPRSAGTFIDLGGGDILSGSPLTLGLTDTELDGITSGRLVVGDVNAGVATISAAIDLANSDTLEVITGGDITQSFAGTALGGDSLFLNGDLAPGLAGTGSVSVDGPVTFDATASFEVNLDGIASYDQLVASGDTRTTTLDGADLVITLDTVPTVGSQQLFRIVDSTGAGSTVSGTFQYGGVTLDDGDVFTVGSTLFRINYNPPGAAGDVILTEAANTPPVVDLNGTGGVGVDFTAAFVEDAGAKNIADTGATITDGQEAELARLTLVVGANPDGGAESLTVAGVAFALNADLVSTGAVGSTTLQIAYVAATRTFTITKNGGGTTPIGDLQTLLRSITYENTDDTPTTSDRTIAITANDGIVDSSVATATITVAATNDVPVAQTSGVLTNEDIAKAFAVSDFSFTDAEGNSLASITISSLSLASGDTLTLSGTNVAVNQTILASDIANLVYTPAANGNGIARATFDFKVNDADSGTVAATMTINVAAVNDDPTADDDAVTVGEDDVGSDVTATLLAGDTDPDPTDVLAVTLVDGSGTTGMVTLTAEVVSYDPNGQFDWLAEGETTTDSFNYTVGDGNGGTATATVTVTVTGVNDDPTADDDAVGTDENAALSPVDVLANDTDPDTTDTLAVTLVDGSGTTGMVTLTAGVVSYDPNGQFDWLAEGETTTDSFNYTVSDGNGGTATATVTVTVTGVNDPPVANDDYGGSTDEDTPLTTVDASANDTDPEADTLTVTAFDTSSVKGAAVNDNGDGTFDYDPTGSTTLNALAEGETTTDTFDYTVSDGKGGTAGATVTVTVTGVNDPPSLTVGPTSQTVQYSDSMTTLAISADDVDSPSLSVATSFSVDGGASQVGLPAGLTLDGSCAAVPCSWTITGTMQVAPGAYVVTVTVNDGALTASADATIIVEQEDARSFYVGPLFVSTPSASNGLVDVELRATVQDITAATADPATDSNAGDIRNATVEFRDDTGGLLCAASSLDLVIVGDPSVATAACTWTADIGNAGATEFEIHIVVDGYYVDTSDTEIVVTVVGLDPAASTDPAAAAAIEEAAGLVEEAIGMFDAGQEEAALGTILDAIEKIEEAEAADSTLDLTDVKAALASLAKSVAVTGIADAEATGTTKRAELRKIAAAHELVAEGDALFAAGDYLAAADAYTKAYLKVKDIGGGDDPPTDNPPTVNVTDPAEGETVSGTTVPVAATATDDNGVTQVEFFVDGNSIGVDTTAPYEVTWDSTTVANGTHTVSATVTDTTGQTTSDSNNITVNNADGTDVHVGDLDGSAVVTGPGGKWEATVTITVHDSLHDPVDGATVNGSWSDGATGSGSCVTSDGTCDIVKGNINKNSSSVTFTVTSVTHATLAHASGDNHDGDDPADSNGTVIVVNEAPA